MFIAHALRLAPFSAMQSRAPSQPQSGKQQLMMRSPLNGLP
jgi:hypothetical protein